MKKEQAGDQTSITQTTLKKFWRVNPLSPNGRVGRLTYVTVGVGLMIIKYIAELIVVSNYSEAFYSPIIFLLPSMSTRERLMEGMPEWMGWAWVLWSLPFMWIAIAISIRRAADSGAKSGLGFVVLLPLINLFVMLALCVWPTSSKTPEQREDQARDIKESTAIAIGILSGMITTVLLTCASVFLLQSYGYALFIGMPIFAGAIASFSYNRPAQRGLGSSLMVGTAAVGLGACALLLFAVEGVICLLMAAPLILPLGCLGGFLGWSMANVSSAGISQIAGTFLLLPLVAAMEPTNTREFEVCTSVEINASPSDVWSHVVDFPAIESPPGGYFNFGIAFPVDARIDGQGVGATRYCEFTTGEFVEPITVWKEPNRLAFDVTSQPEPMKELTPYRHIHPPHLEGSFRSVRGEFLLVALPNGRTRLEGRTWYILEIGPVSYWRLLTDRILHDIHRHVLHHVKNVSER